MAGADLLYASQPRRSALYGKLVKAPAFENPPDSYDASIRDCSDNPHFGWFSDHFFGVEYLANSTGYLIVLGIQAILLFNAFIPHIAATVRFHVYSPGVISAVLITLPFSFYLFRRALDDNLLSWNQFWGLLGLAPFAMVIFAFISLQIGNAFTKKSA